jgi:hypothetical protein
MVGAGKTAIINQFVHPLVLESKLATLKSLTSATYAIKRNDSKKLSIQIEYLNQDDLDRIYEIYERNSQAVLDWCKVVHENIGSILSANPFHHKGAQRICMEKKAELGQLKAKLGLISIRVFLHLVFIASFWLSRLTY